MGERARTKVGIAIVLKCWLAWGLAIVEDYDAKRVGWLALDVYCPPAGIIRGVYLYSSR